MQKNNQFKLLYNQLWLFDERKVQQINPQVKLGQWQNIEDSGDNMRENVAILMSEQTKLRVEKEEKWLTKRKETPAILAKSIVLNQSNEFKINVPQDLINNWDSLVSSINICNKCDLSNGRQNTVIDRGNRQAKWMFIGEAPGEHDDVKGVPFVGASGELLDKMITAMKLDVNNDVYICNVIKCNPPYNRNPESHEVNMCNNYLLSQINLVKPQIIIALGRFASQALLSSDLATNKLRGQVHSIKNIPVIVTYHPAYLLRNVAAKKDAWEDLQLAMKVFNSNENKN
jgi:uracil-DNA glycosylase family 4